jgi:hypothetical protein
VATDEDCQRFAAICGMLCKPFFPIRSKTREAIPLRLSALG